jgi:predicted dehydrogenase
VLINLIHDIDMLVYLLGDVHAVQGSLSSAVRDGWRTLQATQALLQAARTGQRHICPAFQP